MRGCLGGMFYLFVTLPIIATLLFLIGVVQTAFNREFFAETLTNDALYDALYSDVLPEQIMSNLGSATTDERSSIALALAFREIIPREYLQTEVSRMVDESFDFFEGETESLFLVMDLTTVKRSLEGAGGENFSTVLVTNLPACDQTSASDTYFEGTSLPSCKPSGVTDEALITQVNGVLPEITASLPDKLDIMEEPAVAEDGTTDIVGQVNSVGVNSMVATIFGLLLINGLIGGGLRSMFGWMGRMLIVPALMNAAIGAFLAYMPLNDWFETESRMNQTAIDKALSDTLGNAISEVGMGIFVVNVIAIVVAVLFMFLGVFGRGRENTYSDGPPVVPPSGRITQLPNSSSSNPIQGI